MLGTVGDRTSRRGLVFGRHSSARIVQDGVTDVVGIDERGGEVVAATVALAAVDV